MLATTCAHAQTELDVAVDRDKLYSSELLNMTVTANSEIELSLGGLFNIGGSQIDPPEFENLERHWEVIDRQQNYNMRSINGKSSSQITWRYTLSPKTTGNLTIPQATFKDGRSQAIRIEVLAGTPPRDASNPPFVFIEATVDQNSAYVQEQILFTLTVFARGQVASGDMSAPSHPDLIIEPIGDTVKSYRMAYNQRYESHERKYLLFPQKSGPIYIDPQTFTGTVVDNRTRRSQRAREVSNSLELDIQAPPNGYSGRTWLPAKALYISESWEPETTEISVGDSLTRSIELTSLGLLASALPPISQTDAANFKVYPDQPELNSAPHSEGVQSMRVETAAFVAVTPGKVTLPAIAVPWWDTINNVERVAELPARTVNIVPAPVSAMDATRGSSSSLNQSYQAPPENIAGQAESPNEGDSGNNHDEAEASQSYDSDGVAQWPWFVVALLVFGWASHVYWLTSRHPRQASNEAPHSEDLKHAYKQLLSALDKGSPDLSRLACEWLTLKTNHPIRSRQEVAQHDTALAGLLATYEQLMFTKGAESTDTSNTAKQLCNTIKQHIKDSKPLESVNEKQRADFKPLYPAS
jgi:hypothetical protein